MEYGQVAGPCSLRGTLTMRLFMHVFMQAFAYNLLQIDRSLVYSVA